MATCENCKNLYIVSEDAGDFKEGKGDCIQEVVDHKGKFWISRPVDGKTAAENCPNYVPRLIVQQ